MPVNGPVSIWTYIWVNLKVFPGLYSISARAGNFIPTWLGWSHWDPRVWMLNESLRYGKSWWTFMILWWRAFLVSSLIQLQGCRTWDISRLKKLLSTINVRRGRSSKIFVKRLEVGWMVNHSTVPQAWLSPIEVVAWGSWTIHGVVKGSASKSHVLATNVGKERVVFCKGMTAYSRRATASNNCVFATS